MDLTLYDLPPVTLEEIQRLLASSSQQQPDLRDILSMIDQVWDEMQCDNQNLDEEKLSKFYQHPVWLLNGIFTEQDEASLQHRMAMSTWIAEQGFQRVLDFGGGFGTLACMIAEQSESCQIDIYEPYPSEYAIARADLYGNIHFVDTLKEAYDCLVTVDVLEHVPDPLSLLAKMIDAVKHNGYLLIATCFYPAIKCHLPSTFHFRYSFDQFAEAMGLEVMGVCQGSHAIIYRKSQSGAIDWESIRQMEDWSRNLFDVSQRTAQQIRS